MEDKRILKTKRNFKQTLIRMLDDMPFSKIAVTELCERASSARITFYTYYSDKYELVDDMMSGYYQEAYDCYHSLQDANNPEHEGIRGYENLLEGILMMYDRNNDFFRHVSPEENPYLYMAFYQKIVISVESYMTRHKQNIMPRYREDQTAALLCGGLWAVIHKSYVSGMSDEEAHDSIRKFYQELLYSRLFVSSTPAKDPRP